MKKDKNKAPDDGIVRDEILDIDSFGLTIKCNNSNIPKHIIKFGVQLENIISKITDITLCTEERSGENKRV